MRHDSKHGSFITHGHFYGITLYSRKDFEHIIIRLSITEAHNQNRFDLVQINSLLLSLLSTPTILTSSTLFPSITGVKY
jgi:hypothetical protein